MTACFSLRGVSHGYRADAASLQGVDLTIAGGEQVAITGANGSGKSTLLKLLDGLLFPSSGSITFRGRPLTEEALEDPAFLREFRARVGFVFQEADVQLFCSTVLDELAFGPLQLGLPEAEARRRVADVAEQMHIERLLSRPPYQLSGGEKKRIAIGAVLTMDPEVLLLDEPTNALDPRSLVWLLEVLSLRKRAGRTVVIATHDLSIAAECADRLVVLSEEHTLAADGRAEEILARGDLLLAVNLIHEHEHRHGHLRHAHAHGHGHAHDGDHCHAHEGDPGQESNPAGEGVEPL